MITLTTEIAANDTVASSGVTGSYTALTAIANRTSPVPSFRRLSPSTMVASSSGTRTRLNVATTAAGSVADSIAPTMNARSSRSPVARWRTRATTAAETTTPGTARRASPPDQRRSSADPDPIGSFEDEAGKEDEKDEIRRNRDRRNSGGTRADPDEQPRDDQGDGVRKPERSGDDGDDHRKQQQADEELDRRSDRLVQHSMSPEQRESRKRSIAAPRTGRCPWSELAAGARFTTLLASAGC